MKDTRKQLKIAGIINTILIIAAIVLSFVYKTSDTWGIIIKVAGIVALLAGGVYAVTGYQKDSSDFYKIFMVIYAIHLALFIISGIKNSIDSGDSFVPVIINFIVLVVALVLAFAKDLGKKESFRMAILIFAFQLVNFIFIIIVNPKYIIPFFVELVLTCLTSLFVAAKYTDKDIRGTK